MKYLNIIFQFLFIRLVHIEGGVGILFPIIPLTGWFSNTLSIGRARVLNIELNKRFFLFAFFSHVRNKIVSKLLKFRAKLKYQNLKESIIEADKIKAQTGKKAMVVYNSANAQYEVITKKALKTAARKKNGKKKRIMDYERVKQIEKRSLYVTN